MRSSQFACSLDERKKLWRHGQVLQVVAHWRFHVSTNSMHVAHRQPPVPENLRRRLAQPLSKSISSQLEKVLQQKTFRHTLPGYHLLQSAKDHEGCAQKTITDWLSCFSKLWQLDDPTPLTAVWRIRGLTFASPETVLHVTTKWRASSSGRFNLTSWGQQTGDHVRSANFFEVQASGGKTRN